MNTKRLRLLVMGLLLAVMAVGCTVAVGVPVPPPPYGYARVVVADSVNVRACAAKTCEVVTVAYRGETVTVFEYWEGWARVTVARTGVTGWVDSRFLSVP